MGLSIGGNVVHGLANSQNAFVDISQLPTTNSDGSIQWNGTKYMKSAQISDWNAFAIQAVADGNSFALSGNSTPSSNYLGRNVILALLMPMDSDGNGPYEWVSGFFEFQTGAIIHTIAEHDSTSGSIELHLQASSDGGFLISSPDFLSFSFQDGDTVWAFLLAAA